MLINGFVIKSIEGRIMAGVVTFLSVMILVGWIAINEPARMAAFEKLQMGRSIERGGDLFGANCSTCHGTDGLGITDRAPGLNNPMLFGVNFVKDINSQILDVERQWNDINSELTAVTSEREALTAELGTSPTPERQAEITARLTEINALINPDAGAPINALSDERDALTAEKATLTTEEAAADTTDARKEEITARLDEINTRLTAINDVLQGVMFAAGRADGLSRLETETADLTTELASLDTEEKALEEEAKSEGLSDARKDAIAARQTAIADRRAAIALRQKEIPEIQGIVPGVGASLQARIRVAQVLLAPLYVQRNAQLANFDPVLEKGYMPQLAAKQDAAADGTVTNLFALSTYIDQDSSRLSQVAWGGDLASYIRTTLIHGRPGSNNVWAQPMVAWSQLGGGPLRTDQIDDIVNYIRNWDKGDAWTLEDLYAVNQFAKLHGGETQECTTCQPPISVSNPDLNVEAITTAVMALTGDAANGEAIYEGQKRDQAGVRLPCSSCHLGGTQAPDTAQQWTTIVNVRLTDPKFTGWTPEQYIVDSVLHPDDYVVPGYAGGVMPQDLPKKMTLQDLADVIAFIKSFSGS